MSYEEFLSVNPWRFTGKEKTYLRQGEIMRSGEYLFSPDGCWRLGLGSKDGNLLIFRIDPDNQYLFITPWAIHFDKVDNCYAIMQSDGNFCIYEGQPEKRGRLLWHTNIRSAKGAHQQYDGNFCLYNHDARDWKPDCIVWQAGFNSGLVDHYEFTNIEYEYDKIVRMSPEIVEGFSQVVKNESTVEQKTKVSFSITRTERHTWQTNSSVKLGIKASAKIDLPLSAKIGIEISGEFTRESAEGKEISTSKTYTYEVPVTIPPMSAIKVVACITNEIKILPYVSKGRFALKEGTYSYCELTGSFKVKAGTELDVHYTKMDLPIQQAAEGWTMVLENSRSVSVEREPAALSAGKPEKLDNRLIQEV